jgi:hypothetical protein
MEPTTIIMLVVIFVLMYMVYYYFTSSKSMLLSSINSATQTTTISPGSLETSSQKGSVNFSYAIWFNINDWNANYGNIKTLFRRDNDSSPNVYFSATTNDLNIDISGNSGITTCTVRNIPIQKWVNLLISVYGKSLDVYVNGKLVKTCILGDVPKVNPASPVFITPDGGFNGWVTQFQYWADSTDPQTAWNIYKRGNGSNIFSNLFGNYGLKVALMNDGTEQNAITI